MSPIEKHRLIQDIYFSLQTTHNADEMLRILKEYGIDSVPEKIYQQNDIKGLINATDSKTVLEIAEDLKLDTSVYISKIASKGKKQTSKPSVLKKIFISHAHEDAEVVNIFVQLLQHVGIDADAIFYTSLDGFGTPLGNDFMRTIKEELNDEVLVLFMLSDHFYASPMCLIEMGAAWVQTKDQISVAIPPFDLSKIKGVFQHFQGIQINKEKNIDLLKETLETKFDLKAKRQLVWSPLRDTLLKSIQQELDNRRHG